MLLIRYRRLCAVFFILLLSAGTVSGQVVNIHLKGAVYDAENKAIDGASVFLLDASDKIINQGMSAADGSFDLPANPGKYHLLVSYIGYTQYKSEFFNLTKDEHLQKITLHHLGHKLAEVAIKGEKAKDLIQADGRKLIYNVAKSINAQGTNALEVLRKTPGVIMTGRENTLTLNGMNGALVLINGKQTYLQSQELVEFLKSIPSSGLKSIEIIKNPSSEYDASGTGGIINVVLQKSALTGFSGALNNGVAYGVTLKQNTDLNFNYRKDKLNVFGSYNHAFGHFGYQYNNDRKQDGKTYISPTDDVDKRKTIGSTFGVDYDLDDRQSIGMVFNGGFIYGGGLTNTTTSITDDASGNLLQTLKGTNDYYQQNSNRYNANLNYKYKDTLGRVFSFDADYGYFDAGSKNLQPNIYYGSDGALTSQSTYRTLNGRKINLYAISANYQANLWKGKIYAGAKFSAVSADNDFNFYRVLDTDMLDINSSNFFKYEEQIAAGYLKYEGTITKKLSYDIGLRTENTHAAGNLIPVTGSSQSQSNIVRNYLDFFPSAALTYKSAKSGTFNLIYAKRIDRPAYKDLNPFETMLDELSYWKGNPFLQPQYSHSLSLQYSYKKTTGSLSYTHVGDLSMQITEVRNDNQIIMIPRNLGSQRNLSLSLTQQLNISKWWEVSLFGQVYQLQNKITTSQFGSSHLKRVAGTINAQQSFKLPLKITGEIASIFNSKRLFGPNGIMEANSQVDLGLQKNILKDKGSLRLAVTDIYNGQQWNMDINYNGFYQRSTFRGEFRQVKLNFVYRFDHKNTKPKKEHNSGLSNENQRL